MSKLLKSLYQLYTIILVVEKSDNIFHLLIYSVGHLPINLFPIFLLVIVQKLSKFLITKFLLKFIEMRWDLIELYNDSFIRNFLG